MTLEYGFLSNFWDLTLRSNSKFRRRCIEIKTLVNYTQNLMINYTYSEHIGFLWPTPNQRHCLPRSCTLPYRPMIRHPNVNYDLQVCAHDLYMKYIAQILLSWKSINWISIFVYDIHLLLFIFTHENTYIHTTHLRIVEFVAISHSVQSTRQPHLPLVYSHSQLKQPEVLKSNLCRIYAQANLHPPHHSNRFSEHTLLYWISFAKPYSCIRSHINSQLTKWKSIQFIKRIHIYIILNDFHLSIRASSAIELELEYTYESHMQNSDSAVLYIVLSIGYWVYWWRAKYSFPSLYNIVCNLYGARLEVNGVFIRSLRTVCIFMVKWI